MSQERNVTDPIIEMRDGVRTIVCPYPGCNKQVKKMWNYYSHARTHTDARPYACQLCNATFRWQSSLKSHMRSHERRSNATAASSSSSRNTSHLHPRPQALPLPSVQSLLGQEFDPVQDGGGSSLRLAPPHPARVQQRTTPRTPPSPIHPPHARRPPALPAQLARPNPSSSTGSPRDKRDQRRNHSG